MEHIRRVETNPYYSTNCPFCNELIATRPVNPFETEYYSDDRCEHVYFHYNEQKHRLFLHEILQPVINTIAQEFIQAKGPEIIRESMKDREIEEYSLEQLFQDLFFSYFLFEFEDVERFVELFKVHFPEYEIDFHLQDGASSDMFILFKEKNLD